MKVLHLLASNKYSGAENVVCQIIDMFKDEIDMAYCSPNGDIASSLLERNVEFFPLEKFNLKSVKSVIDIYNPDIIHCHDLKASIIGSMIKNKTIISHIHGNKSNMSKFSLKSLFFKFACKRIDNIIWVSRSCLETYKYKTSVEKKSLVLPNIISVENLFSKANLDKKKYNYDIVYLGRLVYEKNPERLIQIAKCIKEKYPQLKMAIIGDGNYKEKVDTLIKEYKLEENIDCLGFMSNPYKILMDSKVMLMTSIMEGTPMCAIEAMSLGVPVVSTKTDGMIDLIKDGENGYLYEHNEEACECIMLIISKLRKKLSNSTKIFAKEYNNLYTYKAQLKRIYKSWVTRSILQQLRSQYFEDYGNETMMYFITFARLVNKEIIWKI